MILTKKIKEVVTKGLKKETRWLTLEGGAQLGKSNVAILLFGLRVAQSEASLHCIAAKDLDAIRDNILGDGHDNKFMDIFGSVAKLVGSEIGSKYIEFKSSKGTKKILLAGYSNKKTWEKILGKPIENFIIDEINIADKTFIDESKARQLSFEYPFTVATLNGDDPENEVYEHINKAIDLYPDDTPTSTKEYMKVEKQKGNYYVYWGIDDHPLMTPTKKENYMNAYPKSSFYYTTKVLGERGIQDGLLYADLIAQEHYISELPKFIQMEIGIDIGFTNKTVWTLTGFTRGFENAVVVSVGDISESGYDEIIYAFNKWLLPLYNRFSHLIKTISPDSADPIFIKTLRSRIAIPIMVKGSNKDEIKNRVILKEQLLHQYRLLFYDGNEFNNNGVEMARQLRRVRSDGKGKHLDDGEVCIDYSDALDYSLTPHMKKLSIFTERLIANNTGNKTVDTAR